MSDLTLYVLYLTSWRVLVLLCGALAIFLGYRLFVLGYAEDTAQIEGKYGKASVSFRNFAPGTAFALFGAVLIGVMVASSPAEIVLAPGSAALPASGAGATVTPIAAPGGGLTILRGD